MTAAAAVQLSPAAAAFFFVENMSLTEPVSKLGLFYSLKDSTYAISFLSHKLVAGVQISPGAHSQIRMACAAA